MSQILKNGVVAPVLPRLQPLERTRTQTPTATKTRHQAPAIKHLLMETWWTCVAHAWPLLVSAMAGVALPVVIGLLIQRVAAANNAWHGQWVLAFHLSSPVAIAVQLVCAVAGAAIARGIFTHIVVRQHGFRAAIVATKRQLWLLLLGATLYAALAVMCAVAADVPLGVLHLDAQTVGERAITPDGMANIAERQALHTLIVDQALPAEWVRDLSLKTPFARHLQIPVGPGHYQTTQLLWSPDHENFWPVVGAAAGLWLMAHGLLRFRASVVLETDVGPLRAMTRSVGFSLRHLPEVLRHGAVLRLMGAVSMSVCVIIPTELVRDGLLGRALVATGLTDVRLTVEFCISASCAVVYAFMWTFEAVYDAQLYAALRGIDAAADHKSLE